MIVSRQNRKVKDIRRLRRCKGNRAVLEGPHLVSEAIAADLPLEEILATPEFMEEEAQARGLESALPHSPSIVSGAILDSLCDADSPRGILAVASIERGGLDTVSLPPARFLVVAEGLQDPGNVGALARAVEAAGGEGLVLSPSSAHPNHPRSLRASAGSLLRLPTAIDVPVQQVHAALQARDCRCLALLAHGGEDLYRCDLTSPLALFVGAEGPGLSEEAIRRADQSITIPLAGSVESLNTAVAAAIAMFEIRRRSRA